MRSQALASAVAADTAISARRFAALNTQTPRDPRPETPRPLRLRSHTDNGRGFVVKHTADVLAPAGGGKAPQ